MVMKNPFVTNGYAGPEYFCDRVEETLHITEMLTNENNMALISPRRIGKTELIHHCFAQPSIQKDYYTFIIDIYSTNSVSDLVNMFGKAIIDELRPKGRSAWEKFLMALSSLRSEISFDINGAPVWGIGLGNMVNPEITLDEMPLDIEKYKEFATAKFEERNKHIDTAIIGELFARFGGVTSYIQRVMNVLFLKTPEQGTCTLDMVDDAINYNLNMASDTYETLLRQMPEKQRNVFIAISAEGEARSVKSGAFAKKYHLPSPSSVNSAQKGLLEKDFITQQDDAYVEYDKFFDLWLKKYMK